MGYVVRSSKRS